MAGLLSALKKLPFIPLWFVMVFLITGMIINIIQVAILPLWTFNKTLYRWINMHVVYLHWSQLTFLVDWWSETDLRLYGNEEDFRYFGKESAICVANHRSDVDWLIGWVMADRVHTLGTTKCYMKGYLKYLPIMGFSWLSSEYAFVSRNWQKDQRVLQNSLDTLQDFPYPFWIAIFAEGTRLTQEKLQASIEYARSKNIPELQHHLLPRPRGFSITVQHLKDKVSAVYDMEVAFVEGKYPTMKGLLLGVKYEIHLLIRRIPVKDIPMETIEVTSKWCQKLFQEKDKAMSYYLANGRYEEPLVFHPRQYSNLVPLLVWHTLLSVPLLSYICYVLLSGDVFILSVAAVVVSICFVVFKILLHFSDSQKGSSFGLKTTGSSLHVYKKEQ
ncbi:1-acyl-sn-glycerol-3-phosphate acyltransferase delta [Nematostella vectensis]|uniref:1-acyl-sn-glycerol-3-phosphate acyltransferase delta n=1 Tax=Nematostella vectensis TaxID=45351 RepID=UPI00207738E8|nr:1-acyl-sn-glycerol-3-phosphate acyltransferase delta [Nematostella vectensis]